MNHYDDFLNDIINQNHEEYKNYSGQIKWVNNYNSIEYETKKEQILSQIKNLNWSFSKTKPWINSLSKGCQLCGEGNWSCLFITNKCNASCFFCPAQQINDETPSTQSFLFETPQVYVNYLKHLNFKGVSISGGEPLLFFDKTLAYIHEVHKNLGHQVYIWMYTNGILGKEEHYKKLAEAGVNEVRFDLAASNYNVNLILAAIPFIQHITVEIPAIPEDVEKLKSVLPQLVDLNVTNINLHQLRLTNYNAPKLLKRSYTFLHGERVTVLESELAVLEILRFVHEQKINLGVNYCSFHFKNRFQKAGFRIKVAKLFVEDFEEITENGYLRSIEATIIQKNKPVHVQFIKVNELIKLRKNISQITIQYRDVKIKESTVYDDAKQLYFIEDKPYQKTDYKVSKSISLSNSQIDDFIQLIQAEDPIPPEDSQMFKMWTFERIEQGLRNYF